jgi:hypothetical protein
MIFPEGKHGVSIEANKTVFRSDPDKTITILQQGSAGILRQPLPRGNSIENNRRQRSRGRGTYAQQQEQENVTYQKKTPFHLFDRQ